MHAAPKRTCTNPGCSKPGTIDCDHALTGSQAGRACGRLVCDDHVQVVEIEGVNTCVCGSHARLVRGAGAGLYVSPTSGQLVAVRAARDG